MNVYPTGNNLTVKWTLRYSDGTVFPLSLYDYELSYRTSRGVKVATDTTVEDNVLRWMLKADDQVVSGPYSLALKITLAGNKAVDLQYNNAFALTSLCHGHGADVEVTIESNCDVIDLKDAVLQSRKAMDLAAGAVKSSTESAKAAVAAQAAAEKVAGEFKDTALEAQKAAQKAQQSAQEATVNAQKAQASAATASEHITSLNKAIAELPDGQAVSEKVAEHTIEIAKHTAKITDINKHVVYDVTANNSGVKFDSISALLSRENLSTLIPESVRCGGMSIRFVQTSNNNYIQFRYVLTSVTDAGFVNVNNWVDGESVEQCIAELGFTPTSPLTPLTTAEDWKLTGDGLCSFDKSYKLVKYSVNTGDILKLNLSKDSNGVMQFQSSASLPSGGTNVGLVDAPYTNAVNGMVRVPEGATFLIVSQYKTNTSNIIEKRASVDQHPAEYSENLVTSDGVKESLDDIAGRNKNYNEGKFINSAGGFSNNADYGYSDYIPCSSGDSVAWSSGGNTSYDGAFFCFYNSSRIFISSSAYTCNALPRIVTAPENAAFVRGSIYLTNKSDAFCMINGKVLWKAKDAKVGLLKPIIDAIPEVIDDLNSDDKVAALSANQGHLIETRKCVTVIGNNNSLVSKTFYGMLLSGRKYQIHLLNKDFDTSGDTLTTVHNRLHLEYTDGTGATTSIATINNVDTLNDSYNFEVSPSNIGVIGLTFQIRATLGIPVYFIVEETGKDVIVDETLNVYSKNAIENSAVAIALDKITGCNDNFVNGRFVTSTGDISGPGTRYSYALNRERDYDSYFLCNPGDTITWHAGGDYPGIYLCFYNSEKSFIAYYGNNSQPRTLTAPENSAYFRFSYITENESLAFCMVNGKAVWRAVRTLSGLIPTIANNSFNLNGVDDTQIDTKVLEFTDLFQTAGPEIQSFVFFTDPHLFNNVSVFNDYILNIQKYYRNTPTDFVLCGGDWLQSGDSASQAASRLAKVDAVCRRMLEPYYPMLGNHDTNYLGAAELSDSAITNLWFRKYGRAYYNFKNNNTRYYVFDTGKDNDHSMSAYRTEQLTWLAESLLQNTEDRHIILTFHIYYFNTTNIETFAQNIINIAAAYNSRSNISIGGETKDFSSATGKVHAAIVGHSHADFNVYNNGIPVIGTINTQNGGTPSYDLVLIDYKKEVINMVRIGAGSSRTISLTEANG